MKVENCVMSLRRRDSPRPIPSLARLERKNASAFDKAQGQHAEFNSSSKQCATPVWNAALIKILQGLKIE